MFRNMRRKRQLLSSEESELILHRMTSGILAVTGDDGYPYAVPLVVSPRWISTWLMPMGSADTKPCSC